MGPLTVKTGACKPTALVSQSMTSEEKGPISMMLAKQTPSKQTYSSVDKQERNRPTSLSEHQSSSSFSVNGSTSLKPGQLL